MTAKKHFVFTEVAQRQGMGRAGDPVPASMLEGLSMHPEQFALYFVDDAAQSTKSTVKGAPHDGSVKAGS